MTRTDAEPVSGARPAVLDRYQPKFFPYSSHDRILRILERELHPGQQLLDVGTAGGMLGSRLAGRGFRLVGVEIDADAAGEAEQRYDELHIVDLAQRSLPFARQFDWIILADILEHLAEPGRVLDECCAALLPGGRVIVSVPNVAHASVRAGLLFGRFPYAERGILDGTHLRFYTWRSLRQLLEQHGFRVLERSVTPAPLELVWPILGHPKLRWVGGLNYQAARVWKSLLAYQNVVVAAPGS